MPDRSVLRCLVPLALGLLTAAWAAPAARAQLIINVSQSGSDVVATGSGSLNLVGLTTDGVQKSDVGFLRGNTAIMIVGPTTAPGDDYYTGFTGPTSFGSGGSHLASFGSGPIAGIAGVNGNLAVPLGYVSGSTISDSATWTGQTFTTLGLATGTYTYTWGSGASNGQAVVVNIGTTSVPEPSMLTLSALVVGVGCLVMRFRRKTPARRST